jgi:hypothetical protein
MTRQVRAVALLVGALGFLAGSTTLVDNSLLTHLATGRLIWSGDGIPRADPYTFTAFGDPWVVQSWFASVVFGGIDEVVGLAGLRLLFGVLMGATLVGCWYLVAPAGDLVRRVLAVTPVLVVAAEGWDQRPYLFAYACLVLALLSCEGRLDPRWLLPAGWIWVNTHGSWPLGLLAVAALWAGARLDGEAADVERRAGLWLGAGMLAGALNPYGLRLLAFPLTAVSRREVFKGILEWQAPTFDDKAQYAFIAVLLLAVVAMVRRPTWRGAIPVLVFVPLALTSARNIDIAALVLLPGIARGLRSDAREEGRFQLPAMPVAVAAIALIAVGAARVGSSDDFSDAPYPAEATDWLEDHGLAPTEARVVAREFVGNYFEARYGTEARVFVDDRYELIPVDVIEDARELMAGSPGWAEALARYDPEAVVWQVDSPLAELLALDEGWRIAYRDDSWLVAVPA